MGPTSISEGACDEASAPEVYKAELERPSDPHQTHV